MYDKFDQLVCELAQHQGIDTLIFQHEMGKERSVSEILDTREDSYNHLVRIVPGNFVKQPWYQWNERYPTIWFVQQHGFLVDTKCCLDFELDTENLNLVKLKGKKSDKTKEKEQDQTMKIVMDEPDEKKTTS